MPSPNYIPASDSEFYIWQNNFEALISAAPATYGLTAGDATAIGTASLNWETAYALSQAPTTRTPVTVAAKDTARFEAEAVMRPYAVAVSLNAAVLVADKVALRVNPRTSTPTPVVAPTTFPVLSIDLVNTGIMDLRYRDDGAPATSRAKPVNVTQIQVFGVPSNTVISDPATLPLIGVFTKVPVRLEWDSSDAGKTAYIAARWQTRKGLVGPWSPITPIIIA